MSFDRRHFIRTLGLATAGGLLLPPRLALAKKKKLAFRLDKVPKLKKIGGWTILKLRNHTILFVRDTAKTIKAFSPVCTHKRCTVGYKHEDKHLVCPCHGSRYSLTGKVLRPPAPRPLLTYPAYISKGRVIVVVGE